MPRARLADVAERAGVSTATASLALRDKPGPSDEARRRVREVAAELGYRPDKAASLLAARGAAHLGLVLHISSTFHAQLADALDAAAARAGFDLVLSPVTSRRTEREAVETLLDSRCTALVLLGPTQPARALTALGAELPTVSIGRAGIPGVTCVFAPERAGLQLAVDHLVGLGHRDIHFVDGPRGPIGTARREGYRAAMRAVGLAAHAAVVPGGADEADGLRAGEALAASGRGGDRPSALICFNDRVAVGVRVALARAGVAVPGDISIVGYDDSPLAALATVDLTSVSQNPAALAAGAIAALGEPAASEIEVPPALVVRTTTAPPEGD